MKTRFVSARPSMVLVCMAVLTVLAACGDGEVSEPATASSAREHGGGVPSVAGRPARVDDRLIFSFDGYSLDLDISDLSCVVATAGSAESRTETVVSVGVFPPSEFHIDETLSRIVYPEHGITVDIALEIEGVTLEFSSDRSQTVRWPVTPLSVAEARLILPSAEGLYVPLSDEAWRAHLLGRELAFSEFLNMPFWAIERDRSPLVTFMVDNPFHNELLLDGRVGDNEVDLGFSRWFPDNHDVEQSVAVTVFVDDASGDRLLPARRFRDRLVERGEFVSFREKIAAVPLNERLIGAAHGVLHRGVPIDGTDILPGRVVDLASRIVEEAELDVHSLGAHIKALLQERDPQLWDDTLEVAESEGDLPYLRVMFCANLSRILVSTDFYSPEVRPVAGLEGRPYDVSSSPAEIVRANCELLYAHYRDYLTPPESWGGAVAVSTRMIDMVADAGFDRFRFQVDGVEQVNFRPEVAAYAAERGFLFGPYDSYHSIHDPAYAGTDSSWETAQFDQEAFDRGGVLRADQTPIRGFLGRGKRFSPIYARPYYEQRVERNFAEVPYTYYFIDCDAYGEYSDDYTPGRIVSQREDAEERLDRIRRLVENRSVPVGSEGAFYLFAPILSIVEGLIYPVIAWGDEDMHDPDSEYFLGRYWPPDEPEINFMQVPLKEEYYHLYIDPRFKLPLFEAVFHDSVVAIPRDGGTRKFTNAQGTLELCHLLYQTPPLYHLNLQSGEAILTEALALCRVFRTTHEYSIDYPVTGFDFLTEDRLVQRATFGELEITANFRDSAVTIDEQTIPAMSAVLRNGEERWEYSARR